MQSIDRVKAHSSHSEEVIDLRPARPGANTFVRVLSGICSQRRKTRSCPSTPRLDGKRVLVTGGTAGIGEFITRGLIERGADVISLSRGFSQSVTASAVVHRLQADLADPESIVNVVSSLENSAIDLLICNSGVLMQDERKTADGLEKTFAVNVFGHHLLYKLLIERGVLSKGARIVMTTGDIYRTETRCSAEIPFDSTSKTYARSKLGNLWQVAELAHRYPDVYPVAVHPGVVASGFSGPKTGVGGWIRGKLLISEQAGAQAALIAATQAIPRGAYWHNVFGLVDLPGDDPAMDRKRATVLWQQLEQLAGPYLTPVNPDVGGQA